MKLWQRIKTLIMSSRQKTIPELHAAEDVLKIIWDIAGQRRSSSHIQNKIVFHAISCVYQESNESRA